MSLKTAIKRAALVTLIASSSAALAQASSWTGGTGDWTSDGNPGWNGTGVPNAIGAVANYPGAIPSDTITSLPTSDPGRTVGSIDYNGNGNFTWNIASGLAVGASPLTLSQDGAGSGLPALITNSNPDTGTNNQLKFTGNMVLNDDLLVTNSSGSTAATNAAPGTAAILLGGLISGNGNLTLRNNSTSLTSGFIRIEQNANTFVGNVLVEKGITVFNNPTSLGAATNPVTIGAAGQGGAGLFITSAQNFANPITVASGSGGTLALGSMTTTSTPTFSSTIALNDTLNVITTTTNSTGMTLSGVISGSAGLNFLNGSTRTRITNGASTYSGGTILNGNADGTGGTIVLTVGSNAPFTQGPLGTGTLTLNGGTLTNSGAAVTVANAIHVQSTTNVVSAGNSATTTLSLSGAITGSGTINSTPAGTKNLNILGDISGFTGTFQITGTGAGAANTHRIQFIGTSPSSREGSQAKFIINGSGNVAQTRNQFVVGGGPFSNPTMKMGSFSTTGATDQIVNINSQTGYTTLEIGHLGLEDSISGHIVSSGATVATISKVGAGTLTLGGPTQTGSAGGYNLSGNTLISNGILKTGHATSLNFYPRLDGISNGNVATGPTNPSYQSGDGSTSVTGTGTLDLNGLSFNEIIKLNSAGFGGNGALINSNTSTPSTIEDGVAVVQITNGGSGYSAAAATTALGHVGPTVTVTGGGGTGAEITSTTIQTLVTGRSTLSLGLSNAAITSITSGTVTGGTGGFSIGDVVTLENANTGNFNGSTPKLQVTAIDGSGNITGVNVVDSGTGFFTGATNSGLLVVSSANPTFVPGVTTAAVTLSLDSNQFVVGALKLAAAGSGYTSAPTVTISGTGTGATANALLSEVKLLGNSSIGGAGDITVKAKVTGTGGLAKVGAGTVNLNGVNTYTGNTTVSGGFLTVANGGSITTPTTGNLSVGDGVFVLAGTASVQNTANTTGTGTIHVQSTGNLTSNNLLADFATIDGTTTIRQNGGTAGASKVETFNIGAGGKLNLKDNDLVVGTAPNFSAVRTAIIAGKTNNAATGITSDITGFGISRGFGYAMGNDPKVSSLLAGSLAGQTFDTDSVLVKFTLLGDADLDGDTDLNDLGLWSNGYTGDLGANPPAPTTFWTGGDFDYDGDTDLNDLGLWSSTYTGDFNGGPGSLVVNAPNASPEAVAILNSMGFTVVPEPSTFVLAGVGLAGLAIAARRRRSQLAGTIE